MASSVLLSTCPFSYPSPTRASAFWTENLRACRRQLSNPPAGILCAAQYARTGLWATREQRRTLGSSEVDEIIAALLSAEVRAARLTTDCAVRTTAATPCVNIVSGGSRRRVKESSRTRAELSPKPRAGSRCPWIVVQRCSPRMLRCFIVPAIFLPRPPFFFILNNGQRRAKLQCIRGSVSPSGRAASHIALRLVPQCRHRRGRWVFLWQRSTVARQTPGQVQGWLMGAC
jgi:hypothetical protein